MAISGVGSSGGFDATKFAASIVKKLDSNKDGSLDKAEFVKGLTAQGVSEEDAGKRFDRIDSQKAGKITQMDIATDIKANAGKDGPPKGAPPAGKPPAGGPPPAGGKQSASASSQSSDTQTYDKQDTNQDGTVSTQEALLYEIKHPTDTTGSSQSAGSRQLGTNVDEKA